MPQSSEHNAVQSALSVTAALDESGAPTAPIFSKIAAQNRTSGKIFTMFERYTERARRMMFFARYEAQQLGSSHIEPEHLLLGVIREATPHMEELFGLAARWQELRAELAKGSPAPKISATVDLPLSNASERILAYAAEESERAGIDYVDGAYLLLGILRETGSLAERTLAASGLNLDEAREQVAALPQSKGYSFRIAAADRPRRSITMQLVASSVVELAMLVLLTVAIANTRITGGRLLIIGAIWLVAIVGWGLFAPGRSYFLNAGAATRFKPTLFRVGVYVVALLHQVAMFGWVTVLGVGTYRLLRHG